LALAARMVGKPVAAVAASVTALHGLCGQSHAAAIRHAAAVACGEPVPETDATEWERRLAGERIAEHLRALFMAAAPPAPAAVKALRAALAAAQRIARDGVADDIAGLADALAETGLLDAPSPHAAAAVDALTAADDLAVIAGLDADTAFHRAPALPDRVPQTGPAARCGWTAADPIAARAARCAEIHDAVARLVGSAAPGWITARALGEGVGYAAVESPRGRLHYQLALGAGDTLREVRVLAPTEWNFHPAGPLAQALVGLRPVGDPAATIARHVADFDPCVGFRISITEAANA
jgi:hypothetical protein